MNAPSGPRVCKVQSTASVVGISLVVWVSIAYVGTLDPLGRQRILPKTLNPKP